MNCNLNKQRLLNPYKRWST